MAIRVESTVPYASIKTSHREGVSMKDRMVVLRNMVIDFAFVSLLIGKERDEREALPISIYD